MQMQKLMQRNNRKNQQPQAATPYLSTPPQDNHFLGDHAQPTKNDPKAKERTKKNSIQHCDCLLTNHRSEWQGKPVPTYGAAFSPRETNPMRSDACL
jgi:hypothetical protein